MYVNMCVIEELCVSTCTNYAVVDKPLYFPFILHVSYNSLFFLPAPANQTISTLSLISATPTYLAKLAYITIRHTLLIQQPFPRTLQQLMQLPRTHQNVLMLPRSFSASPCSHSVTLPPRSLAPFLCAAGHVVPSPRDSVVLCSISPASSP